MENESNYLGKRKTLKSKNIFERSVKNAYYSEFKCRTSAQIAKQVGFSTGRLSQIFAEPESTTPKVVKKLIEPIPSRFHRQQIVKSWNEICMGDALAESAASYLFEGSVTAQTVGWVRQLAYLHRHRLSVNMASTYLALTEDYELRQALFDTLMFTARKLDRMGSSMHRVRASLLEAIAKKDVARIVYLHLARIKILTSMDDAAPTEVMPIFKLVEDLLVSIPASPPPKTLYRLADLGDIERLHIDTLLTFAERGKVTLSKDQLHEFARVLKLQIKEQPRNKQSQARYQLARTYILLGKTTAANDLLDKSFKDGSKFYIHLDGNASLVLGQILEVSGNQNSLEMFYQNLHAHFYKQGDSYHARLTQMRITRLINKDIEEIQKASNSTVNTPTKPRRDS